MVSRPKRIWSWLMKQVVPSDLHESFLGDLEERYRDHVSRGGRRAANRWYRHQLYSAAIRFTARSALPPKHWFTERRDGMLRHQLELAANDLRFAVRSLSRAPMFTVTSLITLALGFAGTVAVTGLVKSIVLEPLPYPEANQLVRVHEANYERDLPTFSVTPAIFKDWQGGNSTFASLSFYIDDVLPLTDDAGAPASILGAFISEQFLETARVNVIAGRGFLPDDFISGQDNKLLISEGLWHTRFGGDPAVLGSTVTVEGTPVEVVGVLPNSMHLPRSGTDLWLPQAFPASWETLRGAHFLRVVGRLKPEVTLETAERDLAAISQNQVLEFPGTEGWVPRIFGLKERVLGDVERPLLLMMTGVAMVLLIGCANVLGLLIARSTSRDREVATRLAVGASRGAVFRQFMVESLALASLGGAGGIGLAYLLQSQLVRMFGSNLPRAQEATIDGTVLLVSAVSVVVIGSILGLVTSVITIRRQGRGSPSELLKGREGSGGTVARNILVVGEVALATVMTAAAGLLLNSIGNIARIDPGFEVDGKLTFELNLPRSDYPDGERINAFHREFGERLSSMPGVHSAGLSSMTPLNGTGYRLAIDIPAVDLANEDPAAQIRVITPDYLDAIGLQLLSGRNFGPTDIDGSEQVMLINAELQEQYFGDLDPLGQFIYIDGDTDEDRYRVIGVVASLRHFGTRDDPVPELYVSLQQNPARIVGYVVNAQGDPTALVPLVRSALSEIDDQIPLAGVTTLHQRVVDDTYRERMATSLISALAMLAVVLAMIGTYGVIAYAVAQRTREFSIRIAVGADARSILKLVFGRAGLLVLSGLAIGVATAASTSRFLGSLLYNVDPQDPTTFMASAVAVVVVMSLATLGPALRAIRVDPVSALRSE